MHRGVLLVMLMAGCDQVLGLEPGTDASDSVDAPRLGCPATYTVFGSSGTLYRHDATKVTWDVADLACRGDRRTPAPGELPAFTHLVVLDDDTERAAVSAASLETAWIGLSDRSLEGAFRWITSASVPSYPPASGAPWAPGEPNNGGGGDQDCVRLLGSNAPVPSARSTTTSAV